MYYAEKVINGVLHFKTSPGEEWKPMGVEMLTSIIIKERDFSRRLVNHLSSLSNSNL